MSKLRPASIFVFIFACASLGLCAQARVGQASAKVGVEARAGQASAKAVGEGRARLSEAEARLVRDSRAAIVAHAVASALPAAHDITRTISRTRAERMMRACIGRFEGGAVVYRAAGLPERAALIFTASSAPRRTRRESSAEREREEREASAKKGKPPRQTDVIEEGDDEGGEPVYLGAVDLETGRCTRGLGVADHPAPR
jgi:hypothetical protein